MGAERERKGVNRKHKSESCAKKEERSNPRGVNHRSSQARNRGKPSVHRRKKKGGGGARGRSLSRRFVLSPLGGNSNSTTNAKKKTYTGLQGRRSGGAGKTAWSNADRKSKRDDGEAARSKKEGNQRERRPVGVHIMTT